MDRFYLTTTDKMIRYMLDLITNNHLTISCKVKRATVYECILGQICLHIALGMPCIIIKSLNITILTSEMII